MTSTFRERLFRKKHPQVTATLDTKLKRCLNVFDITLLGIGHMIGAGIYVLVGTALKKTAGPALVVSFALAGFASLLSALCYAEFGARFPRAGSAYTYAYVGVGEVWAFVIGWNVILEHMLGSAAVARAWSGYVNSLSRNYVQNTTIDLIGDLNVPYLGKYLDFVAFLVCLLVALLVALGSKGSTRFNSAFTCLNLCLIVFVIGNALTYADFSLWAGSTTSGQSRFMPFGISGVLSGSASCFFAYIGFDGLATAGEEAKKPSRTIPLATFYCMAIVTVAYVLMSGSLALMIPFEKVDPAAAYASAFELHGATIARYAVSLGAVCGMMTSLFGGAFSLPRCVYAMANDGLLFKWLGRVHGKTQVPVNAIAVFGTMTALLALLVDVETLVDFLSLGTLMAYSIVAASLIVLRYQSDHLQGLASDTEIFRFRFPGSRRLAKISTSMGISLALLVMMLGFAVFGLMFTTHLMENLKILAIPVAGLSLFISVMAVLWIAAYRQDEAELAFKVRFVPFLPALSLFINTIMMMNLPLMAWFRFGVWMTIGALIYIFYGMRHSVEEKTRRITDNFENSSNQDVKKSTF